MHCAHVIDSEFIGRFLRFSEDPFLPFRESWEKEGGRENWPRPSWCWVMTAHSFVSSPGHQLFFFFSSSHFSLSHTYTHFSFSKEEDGAVSIKTYSSIKRRDPLVILHFFKKDPLYSFVYTISSFQIYPLYVRYAKCDKFSKWKILLSSFWKRDICYNFIMFERSEEGQEGMKTSTDRFFSLSKNK